MAKPRIKTLAERWNGHKWSIQTTPNPSRVSPLYGVFCTSANACIAVGGPQALAERWNGQVWSLQSLPQLGKYAALGGVSCPAKSRCTAVGATGDPADPPQRTLTLTER
jgi:hypothetical protein